MGEKAFEKDNTKSSYKDIQDKGIGKRGDLYDDELIGITDKRRRYNICRISLQLFIAVTAVAIMISLII